MANADGTDARQITYLNAASFAPYFTPDGNRVLFSSNTGDASGREFDIWAVNIDGTQLERITKTPGFDGFPMFSPDGKYLAFSSNRASRPGTFDTNVFVTEWVPGSIQPEERDGGRSRRARHHLARRPGARRARRRNTRTARLGGIHRVALQGARARTSGGERLVPAGARGGDPREVGGEHRARGRDRGVTPSISFSRSVSAARARSRGGWCSPATASTSRRSRAPTTRGCR